MRTPLQRRQQDLGPRLGFGLQCAPDHRCDPGLAAGHRRIAGDRHRQRVVEVGRNARIGSHARQGAAHGRVERCQNHLRRQAADIEVVRRRGGNRHGRALSVEQSGSGRGQRTVAEDRRPTHRDDVEDSVDHIGRPAGGCGAQAGVGHPVQRAEVGLRVGGGHHTHAVGEPSESVQPRLGSGLSGARMGSRAEPIRRVGDDIAGRHSVDGDHQIGVNGQTQPTIESVAGIDRARADCEFGRREQGVEPAPGCQRRGEVVVHQPNRRGAAGNAGCQPRLVGQRPQHRDRDGVGGVRCDSVGELVIGGAGRWNPGHRQQETIVVEPGLRAVLRNSVDVDQHRVHAGFGDAQGCRRSRADRHGEGERSRLSPVEFFCDSDEFADRIQPVGVVQPGPQFGRRPHARTVFESGHDVANRAVTHVGDGSGHRDGRGARGGDHVRGDGLDAHRDDVGAARFGRGDCHRTPGGDEPDEADNERDPGQHTRLGQHRHDPEPRPFGCGSGDGRLWVCEWVCGRRRGALGGSGGRAAVPPDCNIAMSSWATLASRRSSA